MLISLPKTPALLFHINGCTSDPVSTTDVDVRDAPLGVEDQQVAGVEVDNTQYFKEVSQQALYPSCTFNSTTDLWEAVEIYKLVKRGVSLEDAQRMVVNKSRMFGWWNGRNEMNPCRATDATSGCFNRLAMDVIARHGLPAETTWPYDGALCGAYRQPRPIVRPSIMAYREAFGSRSTGSYKIFDEGARRIERMVQTLQVTPGIVFGTVVGSGFSAIRSEVVGVPTDNIGRHSMVAVRYSAERSAFLVRNSHGPGFAMDGYFWMSAEYMAWKETNSLWAMTG